MQFPPVLVYHKIDFKREIGLTTITPDEFEGQIRHLLRGGLEIGPMSELLDSSIQNSTQPRCAIVFDDAYESVYRYAFPIMSKFGLRATIAVVTDFVGEYNSWDLTFGRRYRHVSWEQLKELVNAGWEVASHTQTHADLTRLTRAEVGLEVANSKKTVEDNLHNKVRLLVYPYGRYDSTAANAAIQGGYDWATGFFNHNGVPANYCIPRRSVYSIDSQGLLDQKISDGRSERLRLRVINACAGIASIVNKNRNLE